VPATLEPRHLDRQSGRILVDSTRFAQLGRWTGTIESAGRTWEATPDRWQGSRDRSWGIRPVGESEPSGVHGAVPYPGFFWIYAPMQFDDHAIIAICQERSNGTRVLEEALRVWSDPSRPPEHLGRIEHDLTHRPGSHLVERARLTMTEPDGSPLVIDVEPLLPCHLFLGTGYGVDPEWKHGAWQGPLVVQHRTWALDSDEARQWLWGIVDSVARFDFVSGSTAGTTGWSLFEYLNVGDHHRYGVT
jgi:hypothetical protein